MTKAGILRRETPPRVKYSLTPKGRELAVIFEHLEKWHAKYG